MGRAQDLLAKAMTNIASLSGNSDYNDKASSVIEKLNAQKDKFFFQSLAGLPLANLLFKASEKMISDQNDPNMDEIEKIVQQIEGNLITPALVGKSVGLHPMIVMIALLIGGTILGPLGMLFAVPATGVLKVILKEIAFVRQNAHLL